MATIITCVYIVWTPDPSGHARKGLGNNHARKCLERWNAAVGVDEGPEGSGVQIASSPGSFPEKEPGYEAWVQTAYMSGIRILVVFW